MVQNMNSSPSDSTQSLLNIKKLDIENVRDKKIEGLLLRSKAYWYENGGKCSKYFL